MAETSDQSIPQHVAIIMDGNGRWARARGLARIQGHRRGVETVRKIIDTSRELGIRYLTLYAFSVENWQRPQEEVGALMNLLEFFLKKETSTLVKNKVRLLTIGRTEELPAVVRVQLDAAKAATAQFTEHTLVLALNYGARSELMDAARGYAQAIEEGKIDPTDQNYANFARFLYTAELPDPDLVIRTSGEKRLSNFLLLQSAYAEFVFTDVPWPEFTPADLRSAVAAFGQRQRRFGRTGDQLRPDLRPAGAPAR